MLLPLSMPQDVVKRFLKAIGAKLAPKLATKLTDAATAACCNARQMVTAMFVAQLAAQLDPLRKLCARFADDSTSSVDEKRTVELAYSKYQILKAAK